MENHLLPTSKALSLCATKNNSLQLKILINKIIGSFVILLLQLLERQIFLNEIIDLQHFVCKRAYFKRK